MGDYADNLKTWKNVWEWNRRIDGGPGSGNFGHGDALEKSVDHPSLLRLSVLKPPAVYCQKSTIVGAEQLYKSLLTDMVCLLTKAILDS